MLDFRRFEKFKDAILVITLLSSGVLIAGCSYLLIWMVMTICQTFELSETIVGFTCISAATSMEETITSISICRRELKRFRSNRSLKDNGKNNRLNMMVSNCIGSNIFDLSIGLGVPYLLNSLFFSNKTFLTNVYSGPNITFIAFGLVICLFLFLVLLMLSKFRLTRNFGFSILLVWIIYTVLVILLELKVVNLFNWDNEMKRC